MPIFYLVLKQMVVMFLFMAVGFVLRKKKILPEGTDKVISKLELFVFLPAMNFYSQINNCTLETFKDNLPFIIAGAVIVVASIVLAYPVSNLLIKRRKGESSDVSYKRNVYRYGLAFANFGFIGNFLVREIWGEMGLFTYTLFTFFLSVGCYAWGLAILVPNESSEKQTLGTVMKRISTPPLIALVLGAVLGLFGAAEYIPDFIQNALSSASDCMGPSAMILAGFVVGGYNFKSIVLDKKIYLLSVIRLILIPAVFLSALKLLNLAYLVPYTLVALAAPLGLNTVVFPAAYGKDTKTGASMALVSTIISLLTIPLNYYVFCVLWV